MHTDTGTFRYIKGFAFICVFGVCMPFFVAAHVITKDDYKIVPNLGKWDVHKPVGIMDVTREDVWDADLETIISTEKDRPTYAKLLMNVRDAKRINGEFLYGVHSHYSAIVLLTVLCLAQWSLGVYVYSISRQPIIILKTMQLNIFCAFLSMLMLVNIPFVSNGLVLAFYYVLPSIVIVGWALWGVKYIANIWQQDENPVSNSLYALWHYCGFIFLYNHITTCNVPWLW